jgi:hypothetical protein
LPAKNDGAVILTDQGVCIAGTRARISLWERGLPAMNDNAVYLTNRGA